MPQISNYTKICPVGAKLMMWTDRQTQESTLVLFVTYANTPKNNDK